MFDEYASRSRLIPTDAVQQEIKFDVFRYRPDLGADFATVTIARRNHAGKR
jgi:hypothetical protein